MGDVKCKIKIDGGEYLQFAKLNIDQRVSDHHLFEVHISYTPTSGILLNKANSWLGKFVEIDLSSTSGDPLDFYLTEDSNNFIGVVESISQSRGASMNNYIVLRGYGLTNLFNDGLHTRSFTDSKLQQIVDTVLSDYTNQFENCEVQAVINPNFQEVIPYIVQYKETNFQFLNRLAAEFGEWFFYNGNTLCFGQLSSDDDVISFSYGKEDLLSYELRLQTYPVLMKFKGYDYLTHDFPETEPSEASEFGDYSKIAFDKSKSQIFTQSNNWLNIVNSNMSSDELNRFANRQYQIRLHEMVMLKGASKNPYLKVGSKIILEDNQTGDDFGEYVLINISHSVYEKEYSNNFQAVPSEVIAPPVGNNVSPVHCEGQHATIIDTNDPESLGRVKVKFFWQDGTSEVSPWIRVASLSTGSGKGFFSVPEIDDTVWVEFENGDPDRPFVLTGFYHAKTKPEWQDPENNIKALVTRSGNKVTLDDTGGKETITISTPGGNSIVLTDDGDSTIAITSTKGISITGTEDITISGKNINIVAEKLVGISAEDVALSGSKTCVMEGIQQLEAKDGAGDNINLGSGQTNISGAGGVNLGAPIIKLNS